MNGGAKDVSSTMVSLVNRYFTPFALLLVGIGLAVSQPRPWLTYTCIGLLAFTWIVNTGTAKLAKGGDGLDRRLAQVRLYSNLAVNVLLVYFLGGYWRPIWLLFVLTPVATAIYGTRERTWRMAGGVSLLLVATHAWKGYSAPVDWGTIIVEALFIVFLSLFINELSGELKKA